MGVLGIRSYRPFPATELRARLAGKRLAVVFDKALSYGYEGPIATDLKAALQSAEKSPAVFGCICGLGGRDVLPEDLADATRRAIADLDTGLRDREPDWITKALEGRVVMTVPASCLTVLGGMYPTSSVNVPWINVAFPSTAAAAAGTAAGLRAMGRADDMTVLAMAGDGGTGDIGIQALSGATERDDDFIYVCYDNEAYMNTGTQRSGLTPQGARTTTTWAGKRENLKDMPRIMEAHDIPYVASTSAAYPTDVYDKVVKARGIHGLRYIHMNTPRARAAGTSTPKTPCVLASWPWTAESSCSTRSRAASSG
ncbi:MAG: thiamine pyrophosphate-dependent enzyme [Coriobacteriia bacterium]|nr:thiamine pyrophosphate-dependent enzyme [Coriobacteriia bacterium]